MGKLQLLSVNELDGRSDLVGCSVSHYDRNYQKEYTTMITVSDKGLVNLIEHDHDRPYIPRHVSLGNVDIDSLIEFLQEAKTFISEEKWSQHLKANNKYGTQQIRRNRVTKKFRTCH